MFAIVAYDVNVKRVTKVMKICRKYLTHEQKSVFEGMITDAKLHKMKEELIKLINPQEDSINIYRIESLKYAGKESIGVNSIADNIL